jgi:NAD(P)-dependent dehydrogenase (short-subunit alcohol dehydrogenase family)
MSWSAVDIPDQAGRVAVITGANSGLGLETARELARKGASVTLAVRNLDNGNAAIADIAASIKSAGEAGAEPDLHLVQLDLASLDSVRSAAKDLADRHDRIDLLINNAGVMYTPRQQTADGFEMQFGTNHLGHYAFTGLLIDRMLAVAGSRIVTVSSLGHRFRSKLDFDDLQAENGYNRVAAYGRSKLSNLLFTYELQRRLTAAGAQTAALAAHPGGSNTELGRHIPGANLLMPVLGRMAQSSAMGALPTLRAATDPAAEPGQYYGPDGFMETRGDPVVVSSSSRSHDPEYQRRLWAASQELTDVTYPV